MPTYATQADCLAYSESLVIDDPAAFDRLIERCERDIDTLIGNWIPLAGGLKLDPADLETWEAAALTRAVCAQVEWRLTPTSNQTGSPTVEEALRGTPLPAVVKQVKGPDFEKTFAITDAALNAGVRKYGPKVRDELQMINHLRALSGRASA
jgi:hypothetical protein